MCAWENIGEKFKTKNIEFSFADNANYDRTKEICRVEQNLHTS